MTSPSPRGPDLLCTNPDCRQPFNAVWVKPTPPPDPRGWCWWCQQGLTKKKEEKKEGESK